MNSTVISRAACALRCGLALAAVACDGGEGEAMSRDDASPVVVDRRDASEAEPESHAGEGDLDGGDAQVEGASDAALTGNGLDAAQAGSGLDAARVESSVDANSAEASDAAPVLPDAQLTDASDVAVTDAEQGPADASVAPDSRVPSCTLSCAAKLCGGDGCGGSCGTCGPNQACNAGGQCVCVPSCGARACGDNGCGGVCGSCASGQSCSAAGQCISATYSFALDVYPIFISAGCPGCHDMSTPSAGLDLASAGVARTNLVNGDSGECAPVRGLVVPLSPDTSYLINKLTGNGMCSGQRMPRGRTPLTSAQIELVRAWIAGGVLP